MSKNNLVVEREKKQFTMSRVFGAPREVAWKVCTSPEQIPNWWGPRKYTTAVDKITARTTFDSVEDLDGMLQSGMEKGATETWDRLEELVTKRATGVPKTRSSAR